MPLQIIRNSITKIKCDVLVNSANPKPMIGYGVDSQIHEAAGPSLLEERKQIGNIDVGNVSVTKGYNLNCKYVFHTVGPKWEHENALSLLEKCYQNCLNKAIELQVNSIAFPLISTGTYGFPKDKALEIARNTICNFLNNHELKVILVVFDETSFMLSKKLVDDVQSYIDKHYVEEHYKLRKVCSKRNLIEEPVIRECSIESIDFMKEIESTFSESLMDIIIKKDYIEKDVYKRANIDRNLFSKIRNDKYYQPKKITAIALAIGLKLNLDETLDLIGKAGYTLTHSSKFDIIIEYCLEHEIYDVYKINELLFKHQQPIIGG